jgi:hypothetical protein
MCSLFVKENVIFYKVGRCFICMRKKKGKFGDVCVLFLQSSNRRGQFFILAAVILSVFIFSLAFTVNEVVAQGRNFGFSDYADGIERETNYILDYQVYSGVSALEMENFLSVLEADFKDREGGGNFMFIYGNSDLMKVKNLGTQGIEVGGEGDVLRGVGGASSVVNSNIRIAGIGAIDVGNFNSENTELELIGLEVGDFVEVNFNEQVYKFPVSDINQVIFIIQKDVEDETYVEVR